MRPSCNPFRSRELKAQRYEISSVELDRLTQVAEDLNYRACIRGPHGTGKSTLLEDLAVSLESAGKVTHWYYLNLNASKAEKYKVLYKILISKKSQVNFLDGGETIGSFSWLIFIFLVSIRQKTLLASTHKACLLTTLYQTQVDLDAALTITKSLAGDHWNDEMKTLAINTHEKSYGNCREVFRACYFYCAQQD